MQRKNPAELTQLQRAVRAGSLAQVMEALKNGHSPNEISKDDWTTLKDADQHPSWSKQGTVEYKDDRAYPPQNFKYEPVHDISNYTNATYEIYKHDSWPGSFAAWCNKKNFNLYQRNVPEGSYQKLKLEVKKHSIFNAMNDPKEVKKIYKFLKSEASSDCPGSERPSKRRCKA